jgi:hypothetical protein
MGGARPRSLATWRRWPRLRAVAVLLGGWFVAEPASARQSSEQGAHPSVRACKGEDGKGAEKARGKKKKGAQGEVDSGSACLEIHSPTLDVQEQLQALVRELRWRVGDEEISESLWNFSMELTAEELLGYAKPDATKERMEWRSGKAVVLVKTAELGEGYTRVIVSAQFEGYGELNDALATKRTSWALGSNGKLEARLISGLQARFSAKP